MQYADLTGDQIKDQATTNLTNLKLLIVEIIRRNPNINTTEIGRKLGIDALTKRRGYIQYSILKYMEADKALSLSSEKVQGHRRWRLS